MSRPCSCNGMNPNCSFCSGTGTIQGVRIMSGIVPSWGVGPLAKKYCPHCPEKFESVKQRSKHIIEKHSELVRIFHCPTCNKPFVEEAGMLQHAKDCIQRQAAKSRGILGVKRIIVYWCVACHEKYEYMEGIGYEGKSKHRCTKCQLRLSQTGVGNSGSRPMGHKTRQQHKHVNPRQM